MTIIAIDGPAASGKSTVARLLAARLGFCWLNSGAYYRAAAWWMIHHPSADPTALEIAGVATVVRDGAALPAVGGLDPCPHLREPGVNAAVSPISQIDAVRDLLNREFRAIAGARNLVAEGRDMGTCVFPETPFKFFIDASPEERARRRRAEGQTDAIAERDRLDSARPRAPLAAAPDAVRIDTTGVAPESVVAGILDRLASAGVRPAAM